MTDVLINNSHAAKRIKWTVASGVCRVLSRNCIYFILRKM